MKTMVNSGRGKKKSNAGMKKLRKK